jgi:hypothetical protein
VHGLLTHKGFGEGKAGMAEGSEKQVVHYTRVSRHTTRAVESESGEVAADHGMAFAASSCRAEDARQRSMHPSGEMYGSLHLPASAWARSRAPLAARTVQGEPMPDSLGATPT